MQSLVKIIWLSVWVSSCGSSIQNLVRRMTLGLANSHRTDLFKMRQTVNITIVLDLQKVGFGEGGGCTKSPYLLFITSPNRFSCTTKYALKISAITLCRTKWLHFCCCVSKYSVAITLWHVSLSGWLMPPAPCASAK